MRLSSTLVGLGLGVLCTLVQAQSTSWSFGGFTETGSGLTNSFAQTQNNIQLTVTAFSTGSGTTFATANVANYGTGSGFGVRNNTGTGVDGTNCNLANNGCSPQHAMDNQSGLDMLLLKFMDTAPTPDVALPVVLTSVTTGWANSVQESDISLLRYDGVGAPVVTGKTQAQLLSAGWKLVNNYNDTYNNDQPTPTGQTSTSTASSWWLISAYSAGWGSCGGSTGVTCGDSNNTNDYVKMLGSISAIPTGKPDGVPEPGSLVLVAAAAGLMALRRKRVS